MKLRCKELLCALFGFLLLQFGAHLEVLAQQNVGRIVGTVRDPSGAVVPRVQVVAQHGASGATTEVTTDAAGVYFLQALRIGEYALKASISGFKTIERTGVRVVSSETLTVDFELEVGEITQTTEVTAELSKVDTTTSSVGITRVTEEIAELPLAMAQGGGSRTALTFLKTLAVVSYNPNQRDDHSLGASYVSGTANGQQGYTIDGIAAHQSSHQQLQDNQNPIPETIAEFRLTNGTGVEYGTNSGVTVSLVTKSGTNELHGSVFHYLRNTALDARNFFAAAPSPNKQNEFGFVLGGPVVFPKLYNGKNKTFFFGAYRGYRFRTAAAGQTASVPTAAMRSGDFSQWLGPQVGTDALGRPVRRGQIYDPTTTRPIAGGGFIRDPFEGNVIPAARFSRISTNLQSGYPLPTQPGLANNWVGLPAVNRVVNSNNISIKVDQELAEGRHKITFSWEKEFLHDLTPSILDPKIAFIHTNDQKSYRGRFNYYWTIRPDLLLNLRTGVTRSPRDIGIPEGSPSEFAGRDAGLKGVFTPETPWVTIENITGYGQLFKTLSDPSQAVPANVDVSWTKGTHNLKLGTGYIQHVNRAIVELFTNGSFDFNSRETGLPGFNGTGVGYASYLLGEVDSASLWTSQAARWASHTWGFYAQDSWRVTPKLTLNYGLRYDLLLPIRETYDRIGAFNPTIPNPGAGGRAGAVQFWGQGAGRNGRRNVWDTYYKSFAPRLGFAYSLDPKTVLRGGYGIGNNPLFGAFTGGFNVPDTGWGARVSAASLDNGVTPAFNWNNGFPPIIPRLPLLDPSLLNGSGVTFIDPKDIRPGRIQNINFGLERELRGGFLVKADWVANLSHGMPTNGLIQLNQLDPKFLGLGSLLGANINSPEARAAGIQVPYPGFNGPVAQALRPFPQYQNVTQRPAPAGNLTYHALQMNLQKRLGHGLSGLLAYTISKSIGDGGFGNQGESSSTVQHTALRHTAKALYNQDRTQSLAVSYIYELPFGSGKRFADTKNPFLKQVVGGWRFTGIHNYISGTPVAIATNAALPGGFGGVWANRVPDVPIAATGCGDYDPNDPSRNRFLNINAFSVPGPFTLGNTRTLPNVRTCGILIENISIQKLFPIRESTRILFSADFNNAFNRHFWTRLSSNISNPAGFGLYGGASDPRTIQFHLKVEF